MVLSTIKKVILFIPNKLTVINKNVNKIIDLPEAADKTFTYVTMPISVGYKGFV